MSEERLNLIKENVYTRCSIANITGIGMTAPDKEELELLEEIERLNNVINELEKYFNEQVDYMTHHSIERMVAFDCCRHKLQELKGSDK